MNNSYLIMNRKTINVGLCFLKVIMAFQVVCCHFWGKWR